MLLCAVISNEEAPKASYISAGVALNKEKDGHTLTPTDLTLCFIQTALE